MAPVTLPVPGSLNQWANLLLTSGGMTATRAAYYRSEFGLQEADEMIIDEAARFLQYAQNICIEFPPVLYEAIRNSQVPLGQSTRVPAKATSSAASAGLGYARTNGDGASHVSHSAFFSSSKTRAPGIVQYAIAYGESRDCHGPRLHLVHNSTHGPTLQSWFTHPRYES